MISFESIIIMFCVKLFVLFMIFYSLVLFFFVKLFDKGVKKILFEKENKYDIELNMNNGKKGSFVIIKDIKYKFVIVKEELKDYS